MWKTKEKCSSLKLFTGINHSNSFWQVGIYSESLPLNKNLLYYWGWGHHCLVVCSLSSLCNFISNTKKNVIAVILFKYLFLFWFYDICLSFFSFSKWLSLYLPVTLIPNIGKVFLQTCKSKHDWEDYLNSVWGVKRVYLSYFAHCTLFEKS